MINRSPEVKKAFLKSFDDLPSVDEKRSTAIAEIAALKVEVARLEQAGRQDAESIANWRRQAEAAEARVTELEEGIHSAAQIGVGPGKYPNATVQRIHSQLRALINKDKSHV